MNVMNDMGYLDDVAKQIFIRYLRAPERNNTMPDAEVRVLASMAYNQASILLMERQKRRNGEGRYYKYGRPI